MRIIIITDRLEVTNRKKRDPFQITRSPECHSFAVHPHDVRKGHHRGVVYMCSDKAQTIDAITRMTCTLIDVYGGFHALCDRIEQNPKGVPNPRLFFYAIQDCYAKYYQFLGGVDRRERTAKAATEMWDRLIPIVKGAEGKAASGLTRVEQFAIAVCACVPFQLQIDGSLLRAKPQPHVIMDTQDGGFEVITAETKGGQ